MRKLEVGHAVGLVRGVDVAFSLINSKLKVGTKCMKAVNY